MKFDFEDYLANFDYDEKHDDIIKIATEYMDEYGDPSSLSNNDRELALIFSELSTNSLGFKKLESLPEPDTPIFQVLVRELLLHAYFFGSFGCIKSYKKSFDLASQIAHVSRAAQWCLGFLYLNGHYVEKDYSKAFKFLIAAALQRNAYAHDLLGDINVLGLGVPINKPMAYAWYNLACYLAPKKEEYKKKRNDLEKELTNKEIDFAQNIASELIDSNYRKLRSLGFLLDY
jgi:TPR repeat protein